MNIEIDQETLDAVDKFESALRDPSPDNADVYNEAKTALLARLLSRIQIERQIKAAMDRMEEDES